MKKYIWLLSSFLCCFFAISCSCGSHSFFSKKTFRIGIDPNWYPLNFKEQEPYVFGFIEELLLEISKETHVEFERVRTNWDVLFEGLNPKGKNKSAYDGVLSSKKPYNFNEVLYDFSDNFLDTGLVLVTRKNFPVFSMKEMKGKTVGILRQDSFIQEQEGVLVQNYQEVVSALDSLVQGKIEGVLLSQTEAVYYIQALYKDVLTMTKPLTEEGIRLIVLKDQNKDLMETWKKGIQKLKKNHTFEALKQKWGLLDDSLMIKEVK